MQPTFPRTPDGSTPGVRNHAFLNSRSIAVHRNVIRIAGNVAAGLFLSQLIYWTRHGVEVTARQGWVRKTADQWLLETGMSWKVQKRARENLVTQGLIEERRVGLPAQTEYRVNVNELAARSAQLIHIHLDECVTLDLFRTDAHIIKQLLGRATAYHRRLAELLPHINDALFLSRLIQDSGHSERWVCRSRSDWMSELLMSRQEWETSRRHLRQAGLLIERGCNYPRRVDFLVPAKPLMMALAQLQARKGESAKAAQPIRLDRENLRVGNPELVENTALGEIGRNSEEDFPQSVSPISSQPNPAFKAGPIQPTRFAQSRLYLKDKGLQEGLQPPLQRAEDPVVVVVDEPTLAPKDVQPLTMEAASWPNWIDGFERVIIWTYLADLPAETAQSILDEMAWIRQRRGVNTAPGLARKLALLAKAGDFIPEGAHKVKAARDAAMGTTAVAVAAPAQPQVEPKGVPVPSTVASRFAALRQTLAAKNALGGTK
ncbi:hypothetical protein [Aquabacterium sp. NJ1]|uniref:hypothetical protein n=1 Tax=Aquabacterium sp. NJ1 TaxID=1538295 RepID=UPI00068D5CFA|nr:hypothetical protein [Aquabacterium sp. NJ1]